MVNVALNQLGLNQKEINIYLACLKLGPSPVRKIAEVSKVNRGTTYDILKSLIDLGLVSYYHKNKRQYFIAEDPEKLNDLVEQKAQKILETRGRISAAIPQLKSIYDDAAGKPVVRFYEGHNGAKTILQDILDTCGQKKDCEYYVFSSAIIRNVMYKLYPDFSKDRIKAGIKVKVISLGAGGKKRGLDERKWLVKESDSLTYAIIYPNKVAIVTVDSDSRPIGVIIEDKNIFLFQKLIFEYIWNQLK